MKNMYYITKKAHIITTIANEKSLMALIILEN